MKKITQIIIWIFIAMLSRLVAFLLNAVIFPYNLIRAAHLGQLVKYLKDLDIAFDRGYNVAWQYFWNDVMGDGFGNGKETISSRLGKNQVNNTLKSPLGHWLANSLNKIDKNHCIKSIDNNI